MIQFNKRDRVRCIDDKTWISKVKIPMLTKNKIYTVIYPVTTSNIYTSVIDNFGVQNDFFTNRFELVEGYSEEDLL